VQPGVCVTPYFDEILIIYKDQSYLLYNLAILWYILIGQVFSEIIHCNVILLPHFLSF